MTLAAAGQLLSAPISYRTREDVSSLFEEIRIFTKLPVPFRLADLHDEDRLIENDIAPKKRTVALVGEKSTILPSMPLITASTIVNKDIILTTTTTPTPPSPPPQTTPTKPARSRRKAEVSSLLEEKLPQQEEQSSKSFAHLMFNFSSTSKKSSLINLPRGIKPIQVRKVILSKNSKKECGNKKASSAKRSTIVTTTKAAPSSKAQKTSPPRLDLFTRINSAREQENLRRAKLKEAAMMAEEPAVKRRAPVTRTRRRPSNLRPLLKKETTPLLETTVICKTPDSSSSQDDSGVGDGLSDVLSPFSSYCSTEITAASPLNQEQELEDQQFELDFDSIDSLFAAEDDDQHQQQSFCSQAETPIVLDDFSWLNDLDLWSTLNPPLLVVFILFILNSLLFSILYILTTSPLAIL